MTQPAAPQSNLTYTPPPETDPQEYTDFSNLLKESISDIAQEYEPEAPDLGPEPVAEQPSEEVPAAETETAPKTEPEADRGWDRLIQREVAIQGRETQLAQREARLQALEAENAKLKQGAPNKDFLDQVELSPSEALKAIGKDPEAIVRLMIAEQLSARGEEVPETLKKFVEKAADQRRISALEKQLAERDRIANEQRILQVVEHGGREYVKTLDGKSMPSLAKLYKADPTLAHSELMEEIRATAARDPNSELTYNSAAAKVEARLAKLVAALKDPAPANTAPTKQEVGQKPTPPVKPPSRPLKPWERKEDDPLTVGLMEAEREFHRVEAAQRAARK